MVTTDIATRSGRTPRGPPDSRAMTTGGSKRPAPSAFKVPQGLSHGFVQVRLQSRVRCQPFQLGRQPITSQPAVALAVGDDVGNRITADGEPNSLAAADGLNHVTGAIAQLAYSDLQARHGSPAAPPPPQRLRPLVSRVGRGPQRAT